ncbi:MAG: tetratricopeptide repeat protein [Planctomycetes bacterium]|nr:tetratricopeptide repeat protein [Planctomycetota bacterium]
MLEPPPTGPPPPLKPSLVAVVVSLSAAFLACLALVHKARGAAESERRLAALEASLATERPKPAEAPRADDVKPASPQPDPAPPPATANPASTPELAALQASVARLEQRVSELSRIAHASIEDEIAGITPEDLWQKFQMAFRDRLGERADTLLRAFLKHFPNDSRTPGALYRLGQTELINGDFVEGRQFYEQLLRDFPDSAEAPHAQYDLAKSFLDAGDLAEGTTRLEKAVEALKGDPYLQGCALYYLGDTWSKRGQPEVAKEYFRKVVAQVNPTGSLKDLVDQAARDLKALEGR